jgi:hypothetical protein
MCNIFAILLINIHLGNEPDLFFRFFSIFSNLNLGQEGWVEKKITCVAEVKNRTKEETVQQMR